VPDRAHLPRRAASLAVAAFACALVATVAAAQPLTSWNDGPAKRAIVRFVTDATTPGTPSFVPPAERIAVFDNDGTLWPEQPMYVQLAFALDRVRALAPQHPDWKGRQPFKAALEGDAKALAESGERGLLELVMATHAGMTSDAFAQVVRDWMRTARHPTIGRPYTELAFVPMRELLDYLRANGFATWIVSGGGVEFLRVFAEELYGVPPEQVIGSGIKAKYEVRDGRPVIVRLPEIDFIDDKSGKPVGIHKFIGRRPIAAFGNSDGDVEMLEWTTSAPGARLGVIVHHDDAGREFAYDRTSPFGKLDRGLDEARTRGWLVVSIGNDWRTVHAPAR
jgi:phosphoglycolate phosphatase-like HAD superfamily hydrolase